MASTFQINKDQLTKMFDPKNIDILNELGGTQELFNQLHSNPQTGLTQESLNLEERQLYFGKNQLPPVPTKPLYKIMWETFKDPTLILLSVAALVSLALGIYQDGFTDGHIQEVYKEDGTIQMVELPKVHFVEGLAILLAVMIVVLVGSLNDFKKEKQFQKLNQKKENREIRVLRNGKIGLISVYEVLVGDIVQLEPGDVLSTDGILINGHNLQCDESMATGESDAIKKLPYHAAWRERTPVPTPDPFLFSGSKVLEGVGEYLVVAVGENSFFGRIMMNMREETEDTPLQKKLGKLATLISYVGLSAAVLNMVVLLIIYFAGWGSTSHKATDIMTKIVGIIIAAITIVVVAVPEGLPLAVTLSLAFATIRMLKDNNLVRTLVACETMGNATTVCSDKTGTLTTNVMTVVSGTLGKTLNFDHRPTTSTIVSTSDLSKSLNSQLINLIQENVFINSTAFEAAQTSSSSVNLIGSKTECAMIQLTQSWTSFSLSDVRHRYPIAQVWPFSSERKMMSTLVQLPNVSHKFRLFVKGASEIVLSKCTKIIDLDTEYLSSLDFSKGEMPRIEQIIMEYAERSLRTIGLAYVDIQLTEDQIAQYNSLDGQDQTEFWTNWLFQGKSDDPCSQLAWIGVVGIEDPLREGVVEAVASCEKSGVVVRMVTGDNVLTAKAIATQCGILKPGGIVMEGPKFRELSDFEMNKIVPNLRVLARSSPQDKMILVKKLKSLGHVVAVTGDGTNDGPALKSADIGFSMGISGTEVAKEASSIVLMDDNFASIVKAMMWGRMVNDSIKKFLQFQLTINFSAILIAFVSSIVSDKGSVLSAVQLLWVNLIMDTLAALALATDIPDPSILERPPDHRDAPLITPTMWKMIVGQGILQTVMCFSLLYAGQDLVPELRDKVLPFKMVISNTELTTIVFNVFVLLQLFNEINCRRIDNRLNVFQNLFKNYYFIAIVLGSFAMQVIIVQVGGVAFKTSPLDWDQWLICIALGFLSLPLGLVIRLMPVEEWCAGFKWFNSSNKNAPPNEKISVDKLYSDYFMANFNYSLDDDKRQLIHQEKQELQAKSVRSTTHMAKGEMGFFTFALAPSLMATTVGVGAFDHSSHDNVTEENQIII